MLNVVSYIRLQNYINFCILLELMIDFNVDFNKKGK